MPDLPATPSPPSWRLQVGAVAPASLQASTWPVVAVLTNETATGGLADPAALLGVRLRCAELGIRHGVDYLPVGPPAGVRVAAGGSLRVPLDLLQLVRVRPEMAPGVYRVRLVWSVGGDVVHSEVAELELGP